MLERIKRALRITHNLLDEEIDETINVARAEIIRSGVDEAVAEKDDVLINSAIKTYCLFVLSNDEKKRDGLWRSWEYQLDCLRKSKGYMREGDSDV